MRVDIYITISSSTPGRTKKRYGYLLECTFRGEKQKRRIFGEMTGTYNHVTLAAMVDAIGKLNYSCEVHIYAENKYVLGMMKNFLSLWAGNGFLTSKGKPVANVEEWQQLWSLVSKHNVIPVPGTHEKEDDLQKEIKANFF